MSVIQSALSVQSGRKKTRDVSGHHSTVRTISKHRLQSDNKPQYRVFLRILNTIMDSTSVSGNYG